MEGLLTKAATAEDAEKISRLAAVIYREHYTPIIGPKQVEYMLEKFQSPEEIFSQMKKGALYYFIIYGNETAGYFGVEPEVPEGALFLSKVYIEKSFRGKGLARLAFSKIEEIARSGGLSPVWLHVNRKNPSVEIYKSLGLSIREELVTDIGEGYVMDDYLMEKKIDPR